MSAARRTPGSPGPPLVPTGPFDEHPGVARALVDLEKRALEGGASSTLFLPERSVRFEAFAFAYGTGLAKEMNVLKKAPGPLRGTLVVNVSGHATGGVVDRIVAFAHDELSKGGAPLPTDAHSFMALRNACDAVHRAFANDPQHTRAVLPIDRPGLPPITLSRERYDALASVVIGSTDYWKGNAMLRSTFAASNTYHVRVRTPDGAFLERREIPRNNPRTLELSTRIALELPDATGTLVLQAWPGGSAEVGAYREAREYAIHVGRDLFDVERQVTLAERYVAAHDEIRWDSEHELADREQHGVAPAPYPYEDF